MQTYISILRGINVSGQKLLKMDALKAMYENLKFKNVKTYIQSGNVIFQFSEKNNQELEKLIEKTILKTFAFEVPIMVKGINEIENVLNHNPFVNKRKEDITKLHVTFLSEEPEQTLINKLKEGQYNSDEFIIVGKTVYLFCPNGYGNTKLNTNFFENKLKVKATTRNWKTTNELFNIAKTMK